jgi:hypothetical protein
LFIIFFFVVRRGYRPSFRAFVRPLNVFAVGRRFVRAWRSADAPGALPGRPGPPFITR